MTSIAVNTPSLLNSYLYITENSEKKKIYNHNYIYIENCVVYNKQKNYFEDPGIQIKKR